MMDIYELRKVKSSNKKYKYRYQLIIDNEIVYERKSSKEYLGAMVQQQGAYRCHCFFTTVSSITVRAKIKDEGIALTFDALKLLV